MVHFRYGGGVVILSIGLRLKEARKARGMSQELLAEKIGASRGVVTNIEHDKVCLLYTSDAADEL